MTNIDAGVWAGTGLSHPYIFSNGANVSHYSDQVYTGPQNASACVRDITTNSNDYCYTQ